MTVSLVGDETNQYPQTHVVDIVAGCNENQKPNCSVFQMQILRLVFVAMIWGKGERKSSP